MQDGGDLVDAGVRAGDVEQLSLAIVGGEALRLDLQGELGDLEPRERRRVAAGVGTGVAVPRDAADD